MEILDHPDYIARNRPIFPITASFDLVRVCIVGYVHSLWISDFELFIVLDFPAEMVRFYMPDIHNLLLCALLHCAQLTTSSTLIFQAGGW
jgi:hypothetical protein